MTVCAPESAEASRHVICVRLVFGFICVSIVDDSASLPHQLGERPAMAPKNGRLGAPAVRVSAVRRKTTAAALIASGALLIISRPALGQPMSTSPEQAYDLGEIPNVRAEAMGGALNALGVSTASLSLNPANMPLARVYHIEALAAFSPEAKRQTYGAAIVDSVLNSRLAGGVEGTWSEMDPDGLHRSWTDLRAGLGLPLGEHVALGAVGRWLMVEQSISAGPFGASPVFGGTPNGPVLNTLTFDAGATAAIGDEWRIGAVGHNLTNPGTALAPTTAAGGVGYAKHEFAIEADGLADFTTFGRVTGRVMVGGELFLADHYAIRGGWRYDTGTKLNTPSLGFGYVDPRWSIEVAARHDIVADHALTFMMLSLRYFYDATGGTTAAETQDGF